MISGKVAVIGCGSWGRNLVRNLCQLVSPQRIVCCDLNEQALNEMASTYGGITTVNDVEDVWQDSAVAAVAISTPTPTHYQLARQALLSGKHVLVEKPLATSAAEASKLCSLAEENRRTLMVDHVLLFHPAVKELTARIHAGELGQIYHLHSQRTNLGVVRSKENALWSLGPHDVAVMLSVIGDSPAKVTAHGGVFLQRGLGIQDVVFVTLDFPSGQVGNLQLSWLDPKKAREITVVGTRKMAVFDDMEPVAKLRIYEKSVAVAPSDGRASIRDSGVTEPSLSSEEPLEVVCRRFLEYAEQGRVELSDGRMGLEVVRVLEAAQRSLDSDGAPVELSTIPSHA